MCGPLLCAPCIETRSKLKSRFVCTSYTDMCPCSYIICMSRTHLERSGKPSTNFLHSTKAKFSCTFQVAIHPSRSVCQYLNLVGTVCCAIYVKNGRIRGMNHGFVQTSDWDEPGGAEHSSPLSHVKKGKSPGPL